MKATGHGPLIIQTPVRARLLLLGDSGVGKSVYRERIRTMSRFDQMDVPAATIYLDYAVFDRQRNGRHVNVELADAAGSMHFSTPLPNFFRRVEVVLLMFDVGNFESFVNIRERWYPWVRNHCKRILLLANKCDLPLTARQVTIEDARLLASEIGAQGLYELSGRDDDIEKLCIPFDLAVDQVLELHPPQSSDLRITSTPTVVGQTTVCCSSS